MRVSCYTNFVIVGYGSIDFDFVSVTFIARHSCVNKEHERILILEYQGTHIFGVRFHIIVANFHFTLSTDQIPFNDRVNHD